MQVSSRIVSQRLFLGVSRLLMLWAGFYSGIALAFAQAIPVPLRSVPFPVFDATLNIISQSTPQPYPLPFLLFLRYDFNLLKLLDN